MSALISGTGVSFGSHDSTSVDLAVSAARQAASAAGVDLDAVGLLLHVGVYREENICEPSMATLIQHDLGICRDFTVSGSSHTAVSCDLMNGPCGPLNALQVATAALALGDAEHALVVSANVHPSRKPADDFRMPPVGAAVLLSKGDDPQKGFQAFQSRSDLSGTPGAHCYADLVTAGADGRNTLSMQLDDNAHARFLDLSRDSTKEFVNEEGVQLSETLLISSEPYQGFTADVAASLGGDPPDYESQGADRSTEDTGSSSVLVALHEAFTQGDPKRYKHCLFLTVGSGISAVCAHYRP